MRRASSEASPRRPSSSSSHSVRARFGGSIGSKQVETKRFRRVTCLSPDHRLVALARRRAREGAGGAAGVPARCRTPSDSLRREGTSRRAVWANCQSFTARLKNCLDATRGLPALLGTYWYAPRSRPSCRRVRRANRPSEDDPAVVATATPNRSQLRKWPPPGSWEQSYALLQRSRMLGHRPAGFRPGLTYKECGSYYWTRVYGALLAAYGQWLTGYVSLRGIDAHRRDDGDAVRRAVCSAARTGA